MRDNERSAEGIEGWLLRNTDGELYFRIYNKEDKRCYKDYKIRVCDLKIRIIDNFCSITEESTKDYSGYICYPEQRIK